VLKLLRETGNGKTVNGKTVTVRAYRIKPGVLGLEGFRDRNTCREKFRLG